jgi:hypothetical protein
MAVEGIVAAAVGLFALFAPVYGALWSMNRTMGEVAAKTDHNEQSLEDIGSAVNRIEGAVRRSDAVDLDGLS